MEKAENKQENSCDPFFPSSSSPLSSFSYLLFRPFSLWYPSVAIYHLLLLFTLFPSISLSFYLCVSHQPNYFPFSALYPSTSRRSTKQHNTIFIIFLGSSSSFDIYTYYYCMPLTLHIISHCIFLYNIPRFQQ